MFKNPPSARATLSAALLLALTHGSSPAQDPASWNGLFDNNWSNALNWSSAVPLASDEVIFGSPVPGSGPLINLTAGSLANSLWIQDNYTFNANDLTLTSGVVRVNLGHEFTLNSQLSGSNGLTLLGGGVLRLTNALNNFTGTTNIAGGVVVITDPAQLGASSSSINVTGGNPVPSNTSTIGITAGGLLLNGTGGSVNLTRNLNLEGRGPFGDRSGALVSQGNNTLSGVVTTSISTQTPVTNRPTRLLSSNGTLNLSGTFNVGSASSGAQVTTLGGVNTAGAGGNFAITGVLTGLGIIEKSGAGTLFWNPSDTSGFNGRLRVSGAATGGQSSVRVSAGLDGLNINPIFGLANGADTAAPIDLNGGILEIRNDSSINFARNVFLRAASTTYVGPAEGGSGINNTISFGTFRLTANQTPTFNSRNGYGVTFTGAWSQEGSNNNNTITNNMGGTLTFNSSAWNNSDSNNRALTIAGNGNTVITGTVNTSGSGLKSITKTGTGLLTLNGTGATINGDVNINGGTVAIRDFRSISNNTAAINIGTASTAGAFMVGSGAAVGGAANLTSTKAVNLAGSTAAATIFANQTGANPVLLNGAFTAATGIKTLTLGGSNTASNAINAAIPNGGVIGTTTLTATAASAATTMTLNTVTGLNVGDAISGPAGIPGGTTITAINPLTKVVTLSAALTAAVNSGVSVSSTNLQAPISLTKVGGGTWVLGATNTFTGNTSITNGRLALQANAASSNILSDQSLVAFVQNNQFAGGTLEYRGQASTNNTETLGRVQNTEGSNTLLLTPGASGTASLTISQLDAIGAASGLNVVGADFTNNTVTINGANGLVDRALYFNGENFAYRDTNKLRAPVYGTDAGFVTSTTAMTAAANQEVTGPGFNQAAVTVNSLKLSGSPNINLTGALVVTSRGILATNGNSTLSGTGGLNLTTTTAVIRVNNTIDSLTISTPITGTSAGITKNGAGTLILSGTNATTGTFTLNQGTVRLGATTGLGGARALTLRQGATLDLNGLTPTNAINAFNNNGTITSAAPATLTVGGGNGTGTSFGIITGAINVVKTGTGAQSWLGSSTYTGSTTIGSTALVTVDTLANGGVASGIGASSSDASNLIFDGTTGGLIYTGNIRDNSLILGSRSASTDRLFTLSGGGVTLQSDAGNNNAIIWSNTGAIVHGTDANRTVVLAGASTGDNTFNPQLTNSTSFATSVTKNGAGQWNLGNSANTYTGATTLTNGILALNNNGALPSGSPLVLNSVSATSVATFQMSGTFDRNLTATPTPGIGEVNFAGTIAHTTGGVGFAAHATPLTVAIGGIGSPTALTWGSGGFVGTAFTQNLAFGSASALSYVDFRNAIDLNGAATRTINVLDNGNTGADYAIISGDISGVGSTLRKIGGGALILSGDNSYTGQTLVEGGTLQVYSLGSTSGGPATTSVGAGNVAMDDTNAIVLGNGSTTGGILQYTGPGETSERKIRLNTTTGGNQIHADGTGSLILTNVANDYATPTGNKTLSLRGTSVYTNFITSQLTNDAGGGTLAITVDGSTAWVLTNPSNSYTGTTTASAGLLGIGADTALGTGFLVNSNGNIFAYGADRSISNLLTLSNNATNGWQGDYNLTFNTPVVFAAAANNITTNNSISQGKALVFNALVADSLTGNRTWTLNGTGHTRVDGNFTTSTSFGVPITVNNGILSLGGAGLSNFNQNAANIDVDRGTLRMTANNAIPSTFGAATPATTAEVSTAVYTVASTAGLTVGQVFSGTNVPAGSRVISIDGPNQFTASVAPTTPVASGATLTFVASGGLILSPETLAGDVARFDLNGTTQTINALTSTTDGVVVIDNTSASPASFTFGANNSAVNFGSGAGSYTIQNSGGGPLSIFKAGNTSTTFSAGLNLNHTGTTGVTGGTFTIGSQLNGTTGLSVTGAGSVLALTGGFANASTVNSIAVGDGGTLSLLDGTGNSLNNLTSLTLGSAAGLLTQLDLNVGDSVTAGDFVNTDTLSLLTGGTLNLFAGNQVRFNITDTGLSANTTYNLLSVADGGLTTGALTALDWLQGSTPGGFSGFTWNVTDNLISFTTGDLLTGSVYWRGLTNTVWNGAADNWSSDKAGNVAAGIPGQANDVIFQWDAPTNDAVTTTLGQNFKIRSLTFEAATNPANTASSVTINPGTIASNRIEIAPAADTAGIALTAGGPQTVAINAPIVLGANQSWSVANAASTLTLGGGLQGTANVAKNGAGKVVISAAASPTFNPGQTATFTVNAGTLEISNAGALGEVGNSNLANVVVNNGGAFYFNGAASTTANPIALNGGTLSAGGGNQTYSGLVTVNAASIVNLADSNGAPTATARNITLSNISGLTGTGNLTVTGNNTVGSGNQIGGTLTLDQNNSAWSGNWNFLRGTVATNNVSGLGNGTTITAEKGRIQLTGTAGSRTVSHNIIVASGTETSVFEFSQSTGIATTYTGQVTLGGAGGFGELRFFMNDDTATASLTGGVVLANNGGLGTQGAAATRRLNVDSIISETGGSYSLRINDGAWGGTAGIVALNQANTYTGGTELARGILEVGNKDALGSGDLTVVGAASLRSSIDLTGPSSLPNNVILNDNLATVFSNNIELAGTLTGTGLNANRTLTNSLVSPAVLTLNAINLGAAGNTEARVLTVAGAGQTTFNGLIADGNAFANGLTLTNTGLTTLGGTVANSYTGTTTINTGVGTLRLLNPNNAGLGSGPVAMASGNLQTIDGARSISNNVIWTAGTLIGSDNLSFTGTITGLTNGNRTLTNNLDPTAQLAINNLELTNDFGTTARVFTITGSGDTRITGVISNGNLVPPVTVPPAVPSNPGATPTLTITSTGLTVFEGANTYRGATTLGSNTVAAGTLRILSGSNLALNSSTGAGANLTVLSGTVDLLDDELVIAALTMGNGPLGVGSLLQLNGNALRMGGNFTYTASTTSSSAVVTAGTMNLLGNRTFAVNDSTQTTEEAIIQAVIADGDATARNLTKSGTGTLVLETSNTYTGSTTVSNGILRLKGSIANSGAAILNAGTTILDFEANNSAKLNAASGLTMAGGLLQVLGNSSASSAQTVNGLTLNTGGSYIDLVSGAGQTLSFDFGSAITRNVGGTVDFTSDVGSTLLSGASNTGGAILGGWATVNKSQFATVSGGQILPFASTVVDDVSSWLAGADITDSTGFTGTLAGSTAINSLRFGGSGDSTVSVGGLTSQLRISSGGILVSNTMGANTALITGGTLSGAGGAGLELIIQQHNTADELDIASRITGGTILTKSGAGNLRLSGTTTHRGLTNLNNGSMTFANGQIMPYSALSMRAVRGITVDIESGNVLIGGLAGGVAGDSRFLLDAGTLNINNAQAARTYLGVFEGAGTLIKSGVNTQILQGDSVNFTGDVVVDFGLLQLNGGAGRMNQAASFIVNAGGELLSDQDQAGSQNRLGDAAVVILNNTANIVNSAAATRGLWLRTTGQNGSRADTVGSVRLGAGHNVIQATNAAGASGNGQVATLTINNLIRDGFSTALVRGQNLGGGADTRARITTPTAPAGTIGGGGAAGTINRSIVPWLVGQGNVAGGVADADLALLYGNSFVGWVNAAEGLRPLNLNTEFVQNAAGFNAITTNDSNVRFTLNPGGALGGGDKTINALALDSTIQSLTVLGQPAAKLTVASGAILASTSVGANTVTLGGFNGIETGSSEYLIYVTNPTGSLNITSPLSKAAASVTKSGLGNLILSNTANAYTGGTWFNQGSIEVADLAALGTGGLNFYGGGLRWAAGSTFDVSSRPTLFAQGGATFDTNANNVTLAGAIGGGGAGGLTKIGNGILTLSAPVAFSGPVTIAGGALPTAALTYGAANVLPASTNLILGNTVSALGGYLDIGAFPTTLGALNLNINSSIIGQADLTFNGITEINGGAARTLTLTNTGVTTFNGSRMVLVDRGTAARTLTLAGTGNIVINSEIVDGTAAGTIAYTGNSTLTLTGFNTHTGATVLNSPTSLGTMVVDNQGSIGLGNLTVNAGIFQIASTGLNQAMPVLTMGGGAIGSQATLTIGAGRTLTPGSIVYSATNNNLTSIINGAGTLDLGLNGYTVNIGDSNAVDIDMSWQMNTVTGAGLFVKDGQGTLDVSGVTNWNFAATGYQINGGALFGVDTSPFNIVLNGGVFESNGVFDRALGTANNEVQWLPGGLGGGFAARGGNLLVNLTGVPDPLVWGGTPFFVPSLGALSFGSSTADGVVTFSHNIDLNSGVAATPEINTVNGSATVTTADTSAFRVGQPITGTGIPANAIIASIVDGTTFTISANATADGTVTATVAPASRSIYVGDNPLTEVDKAILAGALSGGVFTKTGPGVLELPSASTLSGNNSLAAGTLLLGNKAALGTGSLLVTGGALAASTALTGSDAVANNLILNGNPSFTGTNSLEISGSITNSLGSRTLTNNLSTGVLTLSGPVNLSESNTARTLTLTGTGTTLISGVISNGGTGASNLTVTSTGLTTLTGANSYSGNTALGSATVAAGTLAVGATSAIGSGTLTVFSGVVDFLNGIQQIGALTMGNGPLGTTSTVQLNAGQLNLGGNVTYTASTTSGSAIISGGTLSLGAARTFTVNDSTQTDDELVVSADILGTNLTITKAGNGRLVLGGNNSYGATIVNAGSVHVTGSTGTGLITVAGDSRILLDFSNSVSSDDRRKVDGAGVTLTGGTFSILGSNTVSTIQGLSTLAVNAGASTVRVENGTGQTATLVINTSVTRAAGGTVDFELTSPQALIETSAVTNTSGNLLGGYATVNKSQFASVSGGFLVGLNSTVADDLATWTSGGDFTDSTGYFGTVTGLLPINSVRFDAANVASNVSLSPGGVLNISSGGILVTPNVGTGPAAINGGILAGGGGAGTELTVHQHNTGSNFTINSRLLGGSVLTKTGMGTLALAGPNNFSGITYLHEGILRVTGNSDPANASVVNFRNEISAVSRLEIAPGVTAAFGGLTGGGTLSGTVDIGGTLLLNANAANTFSGLLSGNGTLVKTGSAIATFQTTAGTFTGRVVVNEGQLNLASNGTSNLLFADSFLLNGGSLRANYDGGTTGSNKLRDAAPVLMLNTAGTDGFYVSSNQNGGSRNETVGGITLFAGANTITTSMSATAPTADRQTTITAAALTRFNGSTLLVRGQNLGTTATGSSTAGFISSGRFIVSGASAASLGTIGGILPWAVGDTSITGAGSTFVAYGANGFRALDLTADYEQLTSVGGKTVGNNVRYADAADLQMDGFNKTMNSLLVTNNGTLPITINGTPTNQGTLANLNVNSGAFLFNGSQGITLNRFATITATEGAEYIFHVSNTSTDGVTIGSPLTTAAASLTKSSAGTLTLTATGSTYTGPTRINQGVLAIDALNKLGNSGSGGLVLNGGTLRFNAAFDASQVPVTLGIPATADIVASAGGTFDTNGFDITFANAIGNGGNGGLTKIGAGTLTLNAVAGYTGPTRIQAGGVNIGISNALSSNDLTLSGGAQLNLNGNSLSLGRVTLTGSATAINGAGTLNSSGGFIFNNTGHQVIDATLTSSGGLTKTQSDNITFNAPVTLGGPMLVNGGGIFINDSLQTPLLSLGAGSSLNGLGTITGDVLLTGANGNDALLIPGSDSINTGREVFTIDGALSLGASSITRFQLGQVNFTALEVDTIAYVDTLATIEVLLAPGYSPTLGSTFKLLTWTNGPLTGDLDWTNNLSLPTGFTWDLSEFNTNGIVRVGSITDVVAVSIVQPPQFTSVDNGTTATFNIVLSGSEPWLIQWQKKDALDVFQDIPGENGLTYTIPTTVPQDAGFYRARVSNNNGASVAVSAEAELVVRTAPVITAEPQDATRVSTFNHQLSVSVLGPQPYTFVWKKGTDPDNLTTFSEIVGAPNSATYPINNLNKATHAGFYLVEITNSFGTTVSEVAELVVNDRVSVAQQPVATSAPEGRTATFTVVAGGDAPPGGFTYQWRNGSTPLTNGALYQGVNTPTLSVVTQTSTLSSNYNVQIFGFNEPSNSVPATSNNVALTLGAPTIGFTTNPTSQMVAIGADLTMSAVTSGAVPQTYRWLRAGRPASGTNVFNTNTDTMVILGATVANAGVYTLEASNKATNGSDKKTSLPANLVVVDTAPKRFVLRQGPTTKSPRLSVTTGGPVTGFQWYETDGVTETLIPGAITNTFTPPTGLPAGRKMYFCRVSAATVPATLDGGINEILVYNQAPLFNEVNNSPMTPATITVGELFEYQVKMAEVSGSPDATRTPTTFKMTGAPKGLVINSAGFISGRPSVFGAFTITITASNLAGPAVSVVKTLTVLDIDAGLIGNFTGYIDRHPLNSNLGGMVTLTNTKTGSYTVRLTMGTTTFTGKGQLAINTANPQNPTTTVRVSRGRLTPMNVTFRIRASDGTIDYANSFITSAQVAGQANFRGWIDQWAKLKTTTNKTPALAYSGIYTAGLNIRDGNSAEIPQGTGYVSFNVNSVTGRLTVSGRLADNTAFTTATVVGPQGQVLVFRTLYAATARGSVQGHFVINPVVAGNLTDNTISNGTDGGLDWLRPFDSSSKARTYKDGFFEDLSVVGSHYVYKTPADMGINESVLIPNTNAVISMVEANVNDTNLGKPLVFGPNPELGRVAVHVNSTNRVTVPGTVPALTNPRTVSATINAKTGLVTIKFTLQQANTVGGKPDPIKRAVTSSAMIIRDGVGNTAALGFFLLPQLPTMTQPNNSLTPILSGQSSLSKP